MQRWTSFIVAPGFLGLAVMLTGIPLARSQQPATPALDPATVEFFETKVRPLLAEHCYQCHGPKKQQGGLRLDLASSLRKGSDFGLVVVPGKPEASLLIKAVKHEELGLKMPPKDKLKPEQIAVLVDWVKRGAPYPEPLTMKPDGLDVEAARKKYWAFQPVRSSAKPQVANGAWVKNPIDNFILAKLHEKGLKPVEPADRRTLVRRATFDLTGLPPTPEEMESALADKSPDWFTKVVDRLLASPAYGERWGRHWLDLVRYADTAGDNSDYPVPQLYKYRNWVIQAFNDDKPYDAFVREQLAGDLLAARGVADREKKIIATGYLANARRFGSYEDARYPWHLTIEDTIDNFGRTFLGLTVNCCRCHDHKFDPLTNEDYYALYGFFSSTRYPWPGIELDKVPKDLVVFAPPAEVERAKKERDSKLATLLAKVKRLETERLRWETSLAAAERLPRDEERLAQIDGLKAKVQEVNTEVQAARKEHGAANRPLPFDSAYAVADGTNEPKKRIGQVGNAPVQIKGDPERLGKLVPRRFPSVLGGQTFPADGKGSGRLELANWLVEHPIAARVMVNRVWQFHFGKGIVPTPSDFGKQGRPATQPELLDYLAHYFITGEPGASAPGGSPTSATGAWSMKKLHRLIMLSSTYQLASRDDDANLALDVNNDYLWRFGRHRLDAESIRDAMLAISGGMDRSPGGSHPFPEQPSWNFTQHNPFKAVYETNRRSVYLMTQRIQRHPFLGLFDGADTNTSTSNRVTSTTPLQALYLMNDPFVYEQARKFASRLLTERGDDPGRIERAYLLAFGRPPTSEEQSAAREYLARVRDKLAAAGVPAEQQTPKAWESLVRVIMMSNEFVYVN